MGAPMSEFRGEVTPCPIHNAVEIDMNSGAQSCPRCRVTELTLAGRYRNACATLGLPVWRPGMLSTCRRRLTGGDLWAWHSDVLIIDPKDNDMTPDFGDPATLGCLLAAVREATGYPGLYDSWHGLNPARGEPLRTDRRWWRVWLDGEPISYGRTEAEALVAALERAAVGPGGLA
jgi:hypothetical protein